MAKPTTKFRKAVKISESTFALHYPDGSKYWSKQNTQFIYKYIYINILRSYIKHLREHTGIDKYRAERITGCMEQKNHHHTEIYLLFKDLCFSFNRIFK